MCRMGFELEIALRNRAINHKPALTGNQKKGSYSLHNPTAHSRLGPDKPASCSVGSRHLTISAVDRNNKPQRPVGLGAGLGELMFCWTSLTQLCSSILIFVSIFGARRETTKSMGETGRKWSRSLRLEAQPYIYQGKLEGQGLPSQRHTWLPQNYSWSHLLRAMGQETPPLMSSSQFWGWILIWARQTTTDMSNGEVESYSEYISILIYIHKNNWFGA